jgi:small subunit ribosomal protein S16
MATRIRLARRGRKRRPIYDVVVADTKAPRDGRFIEKLGIFNPNVETGQISINEESAFNWIMKGAQPTDTARKVLSERGIMFRKHLQVGVLKGAVKQEDADAKHKAWMEAKDGIAANEIAVISKAAEDEVKKYADERVKIKSDAEAAVKIATEEAVKIAAEAQAAEEAANAPEVTEEATPEVEATTEETPAVEEAPAEETETKEEK